MTLIAGRSSEPDLEDRAEPEETTLGTLSVVIPTLNEADNLGWVLDNLPPYVHEVVLVDGLSTDGTCELALRIRPDIKIVHELTRGKGAALRAGFAAASGDFVVMLDADGSMDPREIDAFVDALASGFDVVKGSRFLSEGGSEDLTRARRWGNALLRGMVNRLYGARFSDLCYGYMAMRRDAIAHMGLQADGFEIETEIVTRSLRAGLHVGEVGSFERDRMNGVSHLVAMRDGPRVLRTLLVNRFRTRTIDLDYAATSVPLTTSCEAVQP
jgi:glycosyltransferase involved in cell wall biosynthesis